MFCQFFLGFEELPHPFERTMILFKCIPFQVFTIDHSMRSETSFEVFRSSNKNMSHNLYVSILCVCIIVSVLFDVHTCWALWMNAPHKTFLWKIWLNISRSSLVTVADHIRVRFLIVVVVTSEEEMWLTRISFGCWKLFCSDRFSCTYFDIFNKEHFVEVVQQKSLQCVNTSFDTEKISKFVIGATCVW